MTLQRFHYRIRVKTAQGSVGEFIADTRAELDETARRRIIAEELAQENVVIKICEAGDRKRHPGDWSKRTYKE